MGRIRTIKPEFFTHDGLFDSEQETGLPLRIAFAGLWTQCDREGRFHWRPRQLKVAVLPYDEVDFSRVLDALATRGFVVKYVSEGREFGYVPSWHRHQVINNRETASALPQPEGSVEVIDASSTRAARVGHAPSGERKGKEGKGRENISSKKGLRGDYREAVADPIEVEFSSTFWPAYPRKVDRKDALKAFRNARRKVDLETMMTGLTGFIRDVAGKDPQYIRHASKWLNADSWENSAAPPIASQLVEVGTWEKRLKYARRERKWVAREWGPVPGAAGCIVPASLLETSDGSGWAIHEVAA